MVRDLCPDNWDCLFWELRLLCHILVQVIRKTAALTKNTTFGIVMKSEIWLWNMRSDLIQLCSSFISPMYHIKGRCTPPYRNWAYFVWYLKIINTVLKNIHTLQLNFLFSNWLCSKYTECIENVHFTPRTAPRLRPDCTRCFWCVIARANVTSTDPFFSLSKVVNILHV